MYYVYVVNKLPYADDLVDYSVRASVYTQRSMQDGRSGVHGRS